MRVQAEVVGVQVVATRVQVSAGAMIRLASAEGTESLVAPQWPAVLQRPAVAVLGLSWLAQGQGLEEADSAAELNLEVAVASEGLTVEPGWVACQSYFQAVVHDFEMEAGFGS